jgi:hypothetical protein
VDDEDAVDSTAEGMARAFPTALRSLALSVARLLPPPMHRLAETFDVSVGGEIVHIPYRLYNPPLAGGALHELTVDERAILHCLYTRHHDGHVRQASVQELLSCDRLWVAPFVVKLIGEYVVEVVDVIREAFETDSVPSATYRRFASENPAFIETTAQRATSYWNCYYRSDYPNRGNYPAFRALDWLQGTAAG